MFIIAYFILAAISMLLWNALVPDIFHGPEITYWQSLGLLVLVRVLTGSFGGGGWRKHVRHRWRSSMRDRGYGNGYCAPGRSRRCMHRREWRMSDDDAPWWAEVVTPPEWRERRRQMSPEERRKRPWWADFVAPPGSSMNWETMTPEEKRAAKEKAKAAWKAQWKQWKHEGRCGWYEEPWGSERSATDVPKQDSGFPERE
jgi:hypothetical protein